MRRGLIAALAVLLGVGIYLWRRSDPSVPTKTVVTDASAATTTKQVPALPDEKALEQVVGDASSTVTLDPRERVVIADAPPPINPPLVQSRMTDAHAHLQDAVAPCLPLMKKKIGAHDQFRFSYTLTYRQGIARVSDLEVVWSDLNADDLEKCLVERLSATTWTVSEPDWTNTVEDALAGPALE